MTQKGNWIPLDKSLAQEFKAIKRPFSLIEAMFSYTLDADHSIEKSIIGYSRIWNWSRNKTRRFIKGIRTVKGHIKDSKRTVKGQAIHFVDKGLWLKKDSKRTVKGHIKDSKRTGTINPNPNPKKKETLFDDFWNLYNKKNDRKKCLLKFNRLKPFETDLIFKTLDDYIKSTPDIKYRKNPLTYLNNESWNDEIIKGGLNGKNKNFTGKDTREPVIEERLPEY